jgi:hypothetical protein
MLISLKEIIQGLRLTDVDFEDSKGIHLVWVTE